MKPEPHRFISRISQSFYTNYIPLEEMLILSNNMEVFLPGIICSDGARKDWQNFLTKNFLAFHQLSHSRGGGFKADRTGKRMHPVKLQERKFGSISWACLYKIVESEPDFGTKRTVTET